MAAKQYVVTRGQIEKGNEVLAKQGEPYKPQNAIEEKRLLDSGLIAELGASVKGKGRGKVATVAPPSKLPSDVGSTDGEGVGTGDGIGGE
ncbi:hypothetical protein [Vreelandella sp. EE7]